MRNRMGNPLAVLLLVAGGLAHCSASAADWWDAAWDLRVPITIENNTGQSVPNYPVALSVSSLKVASGVNWKSARVLSASGKEFPCQVDDMEGDEVIGDADEVAMLVDAPAHRSTCYLYLSTRAAKPCPAPIKVKCSETDGIGQIENGIVKVRIDARTPAQTIGRQAIHASLDAGKTWVPLASNFNPSSKYDDEWGGWKMSGARAELVSAGPVRAVLRAVRDLEKLDAAKRLQEVFEWQVFSDRAEIASVIRIRNASPEHTVIFTSIVPGFYGVTPGGRFDYEADRFAGEGASGELLTDTFRNGSFIAKLRSGWKGGLWCDAAAGQADKPQIGLGCIVVSPRPSVIQLQHQERQEQRTLRMTESYYFRGVTLWPGQSKEFHRWYCVHTGDHTATKEFSSLRAGISVAVGDHERHGAQDAK